MDRQQEQSISKSIETINRELGLLWKAFEGIHTDMEWVKWFLKTFMVRFGVGVVLLLIAILLRS